MADPFTPASQDEIDAALGEEITSDDEPQEIGVTADDVALAIISGLCAQPHPQVDTVLQQAISFAWDVGVPLYMQKRAEFVATYSGGVADVTP